MTELRDRDLVRLYWPVELRPAFDALFAIDDAMADVVEKASDPTLAAIKLAWWRDRLEGLDKGQVPAEPRLQGAARELLPKAISGGMLSSLEAGWAELLALQPDLQIATARGATLFQLAARLLGWEGHSIVVAPHGRLFAAADFRRRGLIREIAIDPADLPKVPRTLRPITGLAALAARDLARVEPEATPGRAFALLRHRWTGRVR